MRRKVRAAVENQKNNKWRMIFLSLFLFVCVAATTAVLSGRLVALISGDHNVIALVPSEKKEIEAKEANTTNILAASLKTSNGVIPGFQVADDGIVWSTNTEIEIFRISYANGQGSVAVNGKDTGKIIAPGMGNSYTFWLKNTGNASVDYTMKVEAYITPQDTLIPVEARMKNHEGVYLAGSDEQWDEILKLDGISDTATLGVNQYTQYTLEWQWPFENDDDASDTLLGNRAADEDLTLTVVIRTVASADAGSGGDHTGPDDPGTEEAGKDNPDEAGGIFGHLPQTGDSANIIFYAALLAASVIVMILFLFFRRRKDEASEEVEKHEV